MHIIIITKQVLWHSAVSFGTGYT